MKHFADLHTHTIASGHAYSTLDEMIKQAKNINLKVLGITEHAPMMPGTCDLIYFHNYRVIPREYDSLKLLFGIEANIYDYDGSIDVDTDTLNILDYAIASIHGNIFKTGTIKDNTRAVIGAMKHDKVKIIGHPDDGNNPLDYKELVKAAKAYNVTLEVNNSSLKPGSFRVNAKDNYKRMLDICANNDVPIIIGSDAHIAKDIAFFEFAENLLEEIGFPEALILNNSAFEHFKG